MARDSWIDCKTEPQGKRTARRNCYGILVGYIGRTRWETFGDDYRTDEIMAAAWIAGRADWRDAPYL